MFTPEIHATPARIRALQKAVAALANAVEGTNPSNPQVITAIAEARALALAADEPEEEI